MSEQLKITDFKMVDADSVPKKVRKGKVEWDVFFKKIPVGKAIVVPTTQIAPATLRTALKRYQDKGRFMRFYTTTRKVAKGKYITYVVNPSVEEEQAIR